MVWESVVGSEKVVPGVWMIVIVVIVVVDVAFVAGEAFGVWLVAWIVVMREPLVGQVALEGCNSVSHHAGWIESLV